MGIKSNTISLSTGGNNDAALSRHSDSKGQRGFTLIEMLVVVTVIGVIASIIVPRVMANTNGAQALLMRTTAEGASLAWAQITQECKLPSTISGTHAILDTGKVVEDVIFSGEDAVKADYKACYKKSGVVALSKASQPGASAGKYNVAGFEVEMSGGGTSPVSVKLKAVPEALVLEAVQAFNPSKTALDASDSSSKTIQYGTDASGARDVTFLQRIS